MTPAILIGCEFSGVVRDAFRTAGADAVSCDLLASDRPGPHLQCDISEALASRQWDAAVFFPPCTYVCSSGIHWNRRIPGRAAKTEAALDFIARLMGCGLRHWALENPVGIISTRIRKPDQTIQPYEFGHPESKKTCLWLHNLPPLKPTDLVEPVWWKNSDGTDYKDAKGKRYSPTHYLMGRKQVGRWENQTASGQNRLGPSPDRWKIRSTTYQGIADAMAAQWLPVIRRQEGESA